MVEGLDRFADHFASYTDRYALIGGVACDLAMQMAAQSFRATKDLDIVLMLESLDTEFVAAFWEFVRQARYQGREREPERRQFYRFTRPEAAEFPSMLELFARRPDAIDYEGEGHLTPIPMDGSVSSLSAILLDDDYYGWIRAGKLRALPTNSDLSTSHRSWQRESFGSGSGSRYLPRNRRVNWEIPQRLATTLASWVIPVK